MVHHPRESTDPRLCPLRHADVAHCDSLGLHEPRLWPLQPLMQSTFPPLTIAVRSTRPPTSSGAVGSIPASKRARLSAAPVSLEPTSIGLPRGSVLLVDDDEMLRRSLMRGLRRRYTVHEARDAETALELITAGATYDAILCDLHLVGMSGRDLFMLLRESHSALAERLVLVSGVPRSTLDDELNDALGDRFLEKPAGFAEIDALLKSMFASARAA